MDTTKMTDYEFFTTGINTAFPGLEELPVLAEKGDFETAQHIFAETVRHTLRRERYIMPEMRRIAVNRENVISEAERVMQHTFISERVPYTFGREIDWSFNPTYNGYREWTWQLNRHREWNCLADGYVLTQDERYAYEWTEQLIGWTRQAIVPEPISGYRTTLWRTIEAALRMDPWTYATHAFIESPALTDEFITVFFKSICEHGWRLRNFTTAHNWLVMEMRGLLMIGVFYPFLREAAAWREYAAGRLMQEFDVQVYPDSMQCELATGYHHVVIWNYERIVSLYERAGEPVPSGLKEGLLHLYRFYPKIVTPALDAPTMNDAIGDSADNILSNAIRLFPDAADEFLYFATKRRKGTPPSFLSCFFEYGGAAVFRSDWSADAVWMYVDCSPFGAAHQHEDKLSLQLWAYGHELLCEAGSFDYDTSAMREYVLSTRGHNTARIDACDQDTRHGYEWRPEMIREKADAVWITGPTRESVEATYSNGYGLGKIPVTHTRRVIFLRNEAGLPPLFLVIDRFASADSEPHWYQLIWHMHNNETNVGMRTCVTRYPDGVGLSVVSSDGMMRIACGETGPEYQGRLPKYGIGDVEHYKIPTLLSEGGFTGAARVVTVLEPFRSGEPLVKSVSASADPCETGVTLVLPDGREIVLSENS